METSREAQMYRWADLDQDQPIELLSRRRINGEKAMLAEVFLERGCVVPTHAHENEQFVCVLSGELRFVIGDESTADRRHMTVREGEVLHLPSLVPHSAEAQADSRVLDIFSPPSEKMGVDLAHGSS